MTRAAYEEIRSDIVGDIQSTGGLRAHWHGKNGARALRLALVIEFLAWAARRGGPQPTAVTGKSMRCAQAYLDYAGKMLNRVVAGLAIGELDRDAARIARFVLEQRAKSINERDLYRTAGFRDMRDPGRRAAALRGLERAGFVKRVVVPAAEGRPRGDWLVNPKLYTETTT